MKIRSNKALKYNPIRPNEEGIIELKIIEVTEFIENEFCVITIQDSLITTETVLDENQEEITTETVTQLAIRRKRLTFAELDQLETVLPAVTGTYMERRIQRFKDGLLYITQTDLNPVYFSLSEDWEAV